MPSDNRSTTFFRRPSSLSREAALESGASTATNLATRSSNLQQSQGAISKLSFAVLQSRDERQARRKVADEMTEQAEALLTAKLAHDADLLQLEQEIRAQRQTDLQLIAHRHVMRSLGQQSEDDLNDQCTGLFADKKVILEQLAALDGDEDLKSLAAQCLGQITLASADELHERNRRPR
jgi:hypothetical protein